MHKILKSTRLLDLKKFPHISIKNNLYVQGAATEHSDLENILVA